MHIYVTKKLLVVESEGSLLSSQQTAVTPLPVRLHMSVTFMCDIFFFFLPVLARISLKTVLLVAVCNK